MFVLHSTQLEVKAGREFGLEITGHIDGILKSPSETEYLAEFKGINTFTWDRHVRGSELPISYFVQCAVYLRGLYAVAPHITEGLLLEKNKNSEAMLEYHLAYDFQRDLLTVLTRTTHLGERVVMGNEYPHIVQNAIERFLAARQHAGAGTLPDRPAGYSEQSFPCSYCPFATQCWAGYVETFKAEAGVKVFEGHEAADIRSMAIEYLDVRRAVTSKEAVLDGLRETLLGVMQKYQAKKGLAGEFVLSYSINERLGKLDMKSLPEQIQKALLPYYGKATMVETFRLTQKGEAHGENQDN